MENQTTWLLSDAEKEKYISALTSELVLLRTKANISQEELASLIGTSRQTYGSIERKSRRMSWSTFLALIMFYDYNQKTHQMIRSIGVFPYEIINHFNEGLSPERIELDSFLGEGLSAFTEKLDEQALRSIRTMVMVEYARCTDTPGEAVVKAFDGKSFSNTKHLMPEVTEALKNIRERKRKV